MPQPVSSRAAKKPKHVAIAEYLQGAISTGKYQAGDRLPSENALVEQFGTSRPTVARALRDLQHLGLIERRVGSGTYVRKPQGNGNGRKLFGLLIPQLGQTEIFEPICGQIARQTQLQGHGLLWGDFGDAGGDAGGNSESRSRQAEQACRSYIEQQVAGVFFAPLEFTTDGGQTNARILDGFRQAGIPLVLLDRDVVGFPQRSAYDLIGIDNRRGGYLLTQHLLGLGRRRIGFVARPHSAPTVERRIAGYREALWQAGIDAQPDWIRYGDPQDAQFVASLIQQARPDAVVCANDIAAAGLMQTLAELGQHVPSDVGVVGFDDVKYARLLGVPLTTIRQPCRDLGTVAASALLERIAAPDLPPRTILLEPKLVVRKSCGLSYASGAAGPPAR